MEDYISAQDRECRNAFENIRGLTRDNARVQLQYDRYKIWAASVGASHCGASYTKSLDYRLREAPQYREQVIVILKELQQRAIELREFGAASVSDQVSSSSHSDSEEEGVGDDDDDDNDEGYGQWTLSSDEAPLTPSGRSETDEATYKSTAVPNWLSSGSKLAATFTSLELAVECLYKIPVRHPASLNRVGHLQARTGTEFDIYAHFDSLYVTDAFPGADKKVAARLGQLITQRRRILRHREAYNKELQKESDQSAGARYDRGIELPIAIPTQQLQPSILDSRSERTSNTMPKSTLKATTFRPDRHVSLNVADLLAVSHPSMDEVSSIATTAVEQSRLVIPDPPKDKKGVVLQSFQCPYCRLPTHFMSTRAWR